MKKNCFVSKFHRVALNKESIRFQTMLLCYLSLDIIFSKILSADSVLKINANTKRKKLIKIAINQIKRMRKIKTMIINLIMSS